MSLSRALSTNNYGPCKFIVATSAANGTHTTLVAAMAAASAGDTIFLRNSVTENVTITPGVNIACWDGEALNTPSITGTLTMTGAGSSTISGITLITNSAFLIAVTGSAASILIVKNCYLNCTNNTGISFTSSSASSNIQLINCRGDLGTTGIAYFAASTAGNLLISAGRYSNTGNSSTANTFASTGFLSLEYQQNFLSPISVSGSAAVNFTYCRIASSPTNTTAFTTTSSSVIQSAYFSRFDSGSASAISVGAGTFGMDFVDIASSNTNAVTGAGTIQYGQLVFSSTSSKMNVTTQTKLGVQTGAYPDLTFTPVLAFGGASVGITYSTQTGNYRIVGNMLFFTIIIVLTSKGSSTGAASITGMPVTAAAAPANTFIPVKFSALTLTALYTESFCSIGAGGTSLNFTQQGSGQATAILTDTSFANTTILQMSGYYFI